MLESPHYSLSLLNSDVRLQSNGFEMHAGCGSDSISRITRELEPFSHLSQNISMLSLCRDLGHWTMVRMLDWHKGCHDLTSSDHLRLWAESFKMSLWTLFRSDLHLSNADSLIGATLLVERPWAIETDRLGSSPRRGTFSIWPTCRPPNLLEPQETENKVPHMAGGQLNGNGCETHPGEFWPMHSLNYSFSVSSCKIQEKAWTEAPLISFAVYMPQFPPQVKVALHLHIRHQITQWTNLQS